MSNARDTAKNLKTGLNVAADGTIIDVQKVGTSVGSIGTLSGDITIDGPSEHTGLRFEAADITPRHNGAASNNYTSLGTASSRFKNLYLGSGVYLGGTGSSNHLEDYEEGTWTPVFWNSGNVGGTYATQFGTYTKIGRQVFVNFGIQNNSMSGGTLLRLGGLPFSMSSAVNGGGASAVLAAGFDSVALESYQGSNNQVFYDIKNGGYITHSTGQSKKIQGSFTYIA